MRIENYAGHVVDAAFWQNNPGSGRQRVETGRP
jgi:hypothetical protein